MIKYFSKRALWVLMGVAVLSSSCGEQDSKTSSEQESLLTYVNPLIGTAHCR